jgi:hypothetical protein
VAAAACLLGEVLPAALGCGLAEFVEGLLGADDAEVAAEAAELRWVGSTPSPPLPPSHRS